MLNNISEINFRDPAFLSSQYEIYSVMRNKYPIFYAERYRSWIISNYKDIERLSFEKRIRNNFVSGDSNIPAGNEGWSKAYQKANTAENYFSLRTQSELSFNYWLPALEGSSHKQLRNKLSPEFSPNSLKRHELVIRNILLEIIKKFSRKKEMNFLSELAAPFTMNVILYLLGINVEDKEKLQKEIDYITYGMAADRTVKENEKAIMAASQIMAFLLGEMNHDRFKDGILKGMLPFVESGQITKDQFLANGVILLLAGQESTKYLLANIFCALSENPSQFKILKENHAYIDACIEESLRIYAPLRYQEKFALEDFVLNDFLVPKKSKILIMLGAANRDEKQFPFSDKFDITRAEIRHLSFWLGNHFCLGASIARLEAKIVLETMLDLFPDLNFIEDQELKWLPHSRLNGLESFYLNKF